MSVKLTFEVPLGPGPAAITCSDAGEANDVGSEDVVAAALASGFLNLRNHAGRCILG